MFNVIPEQKKPLEEYQIELAKLRIKQEVFSLAREPAYKMFPILCGLCKKKNQIDLDLIHQAKEDGKNKEYQRVR